MSPAPSTTRTSCSRTPPTEVAADRAAPVEMAKAMQNGAALPDVPALAFAAVYFDSSAPATIRSGDTTLASAAPSASGQFAALASYRR